MQIVTWLGIIMFILMILQGIDSLRSYILGRSVPGATTIILLLLFIGSIVMMSLGVIGYYIARIYEEVLGRPRYIIAQRTENTAAGAAAAGHDTASAGPAVSGNSAAGGKTAAPKERSPYEN